MLTSHNVGSTLAYEECSTQYTDSLLPFGILHFLENVVTEDMRLLVENCGAKMKLFTDYCKCIHNEHRSNDYVFKEMYRPVCFIHMEYNVKYDLVYIPKVKMNILGKVARAVMPR